MGSGCGDFRLREVYLKPPKLEIIIIPMEFLYLLNTCLTFTIRDTAL